MSEIKSLYRWGCWKISESEFAGIRVRRQRDFSITIDLEDCCRCELAVECHGSARGGRFSGRQHVALRHASQCCTVLFTSTPSTRLRGSSVPTRWFSDKRLCDNSGYRKVVRTWSRRRCQRDGVAILQAPEEKCSVEQR